MYTDKQVQQKEMWMIKSMQQDAGFPEFLNFSFPASSRIVDFTETDSERRPCEIKRKIKHCY